MRAVDRSVHGMIFFKTGHALHFGSNETKAEVGVFQWCVPDKRDPLFLDDIPVKFGYFTNCNLYLLDMRRIYMLEHLIEENFCGLLFTHRMSKLYAMRFAPN